MMYKCLKCDYKSPRYFDFERHSNRKTPCKSRNLKYETVIDGSSSILDSNAEGQTVNAEGQTVNGEGQSVNAGGQSVNVRGQKVNTGDGNIGNALRCKRCSKVFKSKKRLKGHEINCDGLDKRQCQICMKLFTTKQGKYQHIQYVKCSPPESGQQTHMTNNGTINHWTINNTTINNNNTINIIQGRLSFGKENLEELCQEPEYVERLLSHISEGGSYAVVHSMDDIFFNEKYPNNQTIKKTRKNDTFVEVYKTGKWVKMYLKDIFTPINQKIEDYYDPFFETMLAKRLSQKHPRYKQLVRFAGDMKGQGWTCETIDDSTVHTDKDEVVNARTQKKTIRLMLDNAYDKSKIKAIPLLRNVNLSEIT
jgi:uncharacterized C2H2 Zn-finger protein